VTHALNSPNQAPRWSVALVGNPNCGKTALFNLLTGARQKVANYAGVTVEKKVGLTRLKNGRTVSIIDLPGSYSLTPATPDEQITLEVIEGRRHGEPAPDAIVAVVDATNLRMNLRLVLELAQLGRPLMVALNMADVARAEGSEDRRRQARRRARLPGRRDRRGARRRPRRTARPARGQAGPESADATTAVPPEATASAESACAKRALRPTCSTRCAASSPSPRPGRRRCDASSTASTPSSCIRSGGSRCSAPSSS
jgi:GTP-binding protein EngB required for normal cell division